MVNVNCNFRVKRDFDSKQYVPLYSSQDADFTSILLVHIIRQHIGHLLGFGLANRCKDKTK